MRLCCGGGVSGLEEDSGGEGLGLVGGSRSLEHYAPTQLCPQLLFSKGKWRGGSWATFRSGA